MAQALLPVPKAGGRFKTFCILLQWGSLNWRKAYAVPTARPQGGPPCAPPEGSKLSSPSVDGRRSAATATEREGDEGAAELARR